MYEVSVNKTGPAGGGTTVGLFRFDETKPDAEPEIIQPLDYVALTIVVGVLKGMAQEAQAMVERFGDPAA